ncbi:F0F1 ATP synthase subunit delta [Rhodoligotrophos defluvii]|uniref:F0F1 ATP synthase subunit delta n=1 Tax=Rhodoligotrophos defluvii TaxID=2561934 RepID=UPI0010C93A43|nr:F0F1 ATP synthase subunit delta [Rhodoligotrophos defluvii]
MAATRSTVEGMPGRYATALFELALSEGALDKVGADLDQFAALVADSPDLQRLVRSPVFTPDEQMRAITAVLSAANITGLAANFIALAARNRRLFAIGEMISAYKKLLAAHRGEETAQVTSAEPLTADQIDRIRQALQTAVGRDVQVDTKVEPSILGGLVVKVGSRMIDGSLRTKLQNLRIAMREVG